MSIEPEQGAPEVAPEAPVEKKPGFFKRLFGGGKKEEEAPQQPAAVESEAPAEEAPADDNTAV